MNNNVLQLNRENVLGGIYIIFIANVYVQSISFMPSSQIAQCATTYEVSFKSSYE